MQGLGRRMRVVEVCSGAELREPLDSLEQLQLVVQNEFALEVPRQVLVTRSGETVRVWVETRGWRDLEEVFVLPSAAGREVFGNLRVKSFPKQMPRTGEECRDFASRFKMEFEYVEFLMQRIQHNMDQASKVSSCLSNARDCAEVLVGQIRVSSLTFQNKFSGLRRDVEMIADKLSHFEESLSGLQKVSLDPAFHPKKTLLDAVNEKKCRERLRSEDLNKVRHAVRQLTKRKEQLVKEACDLADSVDLSRFDMQFVTELLESSQASVHSALSIRNELATHFQETERAFARNLATELSSMATDLERWRQDHVRAIQDIESVDLKVDSVKESILTRYRDVFSDLARTYSEALRIQTSMYKENQEWRHWNSIKERRLSKELSDILSIESMHAAYDDLLAEIHRRKAFHEVFKAKIEVFRAELDGILAQENSLRRTFHEKSGRHIPSDFVDLSKHVPFYYLSFHTYEDKLPQIVSKPKNDSPLFQETKTKMSLEEENRLLRTELLYYKKSLNDEDIGVPELKRQPSDPELKAHCKALEEHVIQLKREKEESESRIPALETRVSELNVTILRVSLLKSSKAQLATCLGRTSQALEQLDLFRKECSIRLSYKSIAVNDMALFIFTEKRWIAFCCRPEEYTLAPESAELLVKRWESSGVPQQLVLGRVVHLDRKKGVKTGRRVFFVTATDLECVHDLLGSSRIS